MIKSANIDDKLIKAKLCDRNLKQVAERANLSAQTLYNFVSGRTPLSITSKNKLVNYLLSC